MGLAKKLFKFTAGGATGAAVGMAVGSLLAPQRGEAFQRGIHETVAEARTAGADAQAHTERELSDRFRQRVNDPDALRNTDVRS